MKPTLIIQVGIQRISKITSFLGSVHIANEWKPHYKRIKESPRLRETWSSSPFDLSSYLDHSSKLSNLQFLQIQTTNTRKENVRIKMLPSPQGWGNWYWNYTIGH